MIPPPGATLYPLSFSSVLSTKRSYDIVPIGGTNRQSPQFATYLYSANSIRDYDGEHTEFNCLTYYRLQ